MIEKSLDLILSDENMTEYRFFLYVLPENYLEYKDTINLYIFLHEDQSETYPDYYVEVWVRVSYNPKVIWQVDNFPIAPEDFDESGFQAILDQLNVSEDFLPNLRQLIEMVERAKAGSERSNP